MTNVFDIIIAVPLIIALVKGFNKGFIIEVSSLVALFLGVICGLKFSGLAADQLRNFGLDTQFNEIIAFVLLMILIVIAVHLIAKSIEGFVELVLLGLVNKLLGALFSFLKFGLIICLLVYVLDVLDRRLDFLGEKFKSESILYEPMVTIVDVGIPFIKELAKQPEINIPDVPEIPEIDLEEVEELIN